VNEPRRLDDADAALAGELALGLLEGQERTAALRRMLAEPGFAAAVERWRGQLGGLFDAVPPVAPPPELWSRIEAAIDVEPDTVTPALAGPVRFWRRSALALGALAAVLALALVWPRTLPADPALDPEVAGRSYAVAQLSGDIEGLLLTARYDGGRGELLVRVVGMPETDTDPELWIVPADGVPRSLGFLARSGVTRIVLRGGKQGLLTERSRLVLTMEPPAAAPHAAPSGPPVAQGRLQTV